MNGTLMDFCHGTGNVCRQVSSNDADKNISWLAWQFVDCLHAHEMLSNRENNSIIIVRHPEFLREIGLKIPK